MKRFITLALAVILVMSLGVTALGTGYTEEVEPINVLLINADTGEVLYSKNEDAPAYTAGLVKLMTAYITVKCIDDLDAVVTVSPYAMYNIEDSDITLYPPVEEGEEITVRDLLAGMLVGSGNDCAQALAVYIGGSVSGFVDLMNSYAYDLGMTGTIFTNPTGKHSSYQYSNAADMGILACELVKYPELMEIFGAVSYTIPATNRSDSRTFYNTNRLICEYSDEENYRYDGATGMIAGYTSSAASCLAASAEKYGVNLVCIILGDISGSRTVRWTTAASLFDYGFGKYLPIDASSVLSGIPLTYTDEDGNTVDVEVDFTDVTVKYDTVSEGITAVVTSEDGINGTAIYTDANGNVVAEIPVTLPHEEPAEIPEEIPENPITEEPEEIPEEDTPEEEETEPKGRPVLAAILSVIVLAAAAFGAIFTVKKKREKRHASGKDSFKVKFRQHFMTFVLFAAVALILIIIICTVL